MDIKLPNGETPRAQLKRIRSWGNSWFDSLRLSTQGNRFLQHPTFRKHQQRSIAQLRGLWNSACSGASESETAPIVGSATDSDGIQSSTSTRSNQRATHLIVMANGLFGQPANWAVVCEHMRSHLDMDQVSKDGSCTQPWHNSRRPALLVLPLMLFPVRQGLSIAFFVDLCASHDCPGCRDSHLLRPGFLGICSICWSGFKHSLECTESKWVALLPTSTQPETQNM